MGPMSLGKIVAIVALAFAALMLVSTVATYLLWSSNDEPPSPSGTVPTISP